MTIQIMAILFIIIWAAFFVREFKDSCGGLQSRIIGSLLSGAGDALVIAVSIILAGTVFAAAFGAFE